MPISLLSKVRKDGRRRRFPRHPIGLGSLATAAVGFRSSETMFLLSVPVSRAGDPRSWSCVVTIVTKGLLIAYCACSRVSTYMYSFPCHKVAQRGILPSLSRSQLVSGEELLGE